MYDDCNCNRPIEYPNPPCPPPAPKGFLRIEGSNSPTGPATGGSVIIPIGSSIRFWRTEGGIQVTEGSANVNIRSTPVGFCTVGSTAAPVSAQYPDIGTAVAAGCTYIFVISSIIEPAATINITSNTYIEVFAGVTVTSTQVNQFNLNNNTIFLAGHGNINLNRPNIFGTGGFINGSGSIVVRDINFKIISANTSQSFNGVNSTLDIDGLNISIENSIGPVFFITTGSNRIVNTSINLSGGYDAINMTGGYAQIDNVKITGNQSLSVNKYVIFCATGTNVQVNNLVLDSTNAHPPNVPTFFFAGSSTLNNISYIRGGLTIKLSGSNITLNNITCTSLSDVSTNPAISNLNINNLFANSFLTVNNLNGSRFSNSTIVTLTLRGNNNIVKSSNIGSISVNGNTNNIVGNNVAYGINVINGKKNNIGKNIITGAGSTIAVGFGVTNTSVVGNNTFNTAISNGDPTTFGVSVPTTPAGYSVRLNND